MIDKNFPLYPELSEEGKKEAQELLDNFTTRIKKILTDEVENVVGEYYADILPHIESDSWTNFRNEVMDGYKNYNNRKIQAEYDFKEIRKAIYEQFKEEIIKDLDQDNLEEIERLKREIAWLRECNKRY
jgi:hypothetical protein